MTISAGRYRYHFTNPSSTAYATYSFLRCLQRYSCSFLPSALATATYENYIQHNTVFGYSTATISTHFLGLFSISDTFDT